MLILPAWAERGLAAYFVVVGVWAVWRGVRVRKNAKHADLRRFLMFCAAVISLVVAVLVLLHLELYAIIALLIMGLVIMIVAILALLRNEVSKANKRANGNNV